MSLVSVSRFRRIVILFAGLIAAFRGADRADAQTVISGIYATPVSGDVIVNAGTSATFIVIGDFTGSSATLGDNASLTYAHTAVVAGKDFTFGSSAHPATLSVSTASILTFTSTTSLHGNIDLTGDALSSVINQGTITQNAGSGEINLTTFTNALGGTVIANSGATLTIDGVLNTNALGGTIAATGAGSMVTIYSLVNLGTLSAQSGGALNFAGTSLTTANLGTVNVTGGGHALISGTLDNLLGPFLAPTGGSYELYGGTINNGTVGAGVLTFTSSGGTLNGVSLTGNLTLPALSNVTFTNGTAFTGSAALIDDGATLTWDQGGTLSGKTLTFGSGTSATATLALATGRALTIGNSSVLTGNLALSGAAGASLINQGSIAQTHDSGSLSLPVFTNANGGTITASGGAILHFGASGETITNAAGGSVTATGTSSTIYLYGIVNRGTLYAQNGGVLEFTGANTTANLGAVQLSTGGQVRLSGTLDNTAATLSSIAGGTLDLDGGTITGGIVGAGELGFTSNGGTLDGVTLTGDLDMPVSGASVHFVGNTTFTGANATLGSAALISWEQSGTLTGKTLTLASGASVSVTGTNSTLTLASTTTVNGDANIYADSSTGTAITNQGTINQTTGSGSLYARTFTNAGTINATGGSLSLGTGSVGYNFGNTASSSIVVNGASVHLESPLTNLGTLDVQNGTFYAAATLTNGSTGSIRGAGVIDGNVVVAGGTIAPGNASVGTLTVANSAFSVTGASTLEIEIDGATPDQLVFQSPTANVDLGSGLLTLSVSLLSAPLISTPYTFLSIGGGANSLTGSFAGLPASGDLGSATYGGQSYQFAIDYQAAGISLNFTPIPEPSTYALIGFGLGALIAARRRICPR